MPAPLTPPDCDLRGMPFLPLDVGRLMDSDLFALATGPEFKAAVALWCKAWTQVPAASLPADDRILAHLAGGLTPARWRQVQAVALRGWMVCADGRLYHPMLAELALDAWERVRGSLDDARPTRRVSSSAERMRRLRARRNEDKNAEPSPLQEIPQDGLQRDASRVTPPVTSPVTPAVTQVVTSPSVTAVTAMTSPVTPPAPDLSPKDQAQREVQGEAQAQTVRGRDAPGDVTCDAPRDACKAMRAAGLAMTQPAHPKLLALLQAGMTLPELADAAAIAVAKGKSFDYALAVAEGRRRDAVRAGAEAGSVRGTGPPGLTPQELSRRGSQSQVNLASLKARIEPSAHEPATHAPAVNAPAAHTSTPNIPEGASP